jgi:hypothetical protein
MCLPEILAKCPFNGEVFSIGIRHILKKLSVKIMPQQSETSKWQHIRQLTFWSDRTVVILANHLSL